MSGAELSELPKNPDVHWDHNYMYDAGLLRYYWRDVQLISIDFLAGVYRHFVNPRLTLQKVTKWHNLPIKRLEMKQSMEEVAKFNPRLAQIPTINPRYMWRSGYSIRPASLLYWYNYIFDSMLKMVKLRLWRGMVRRWRVPTPNHQYSGVCTPIVQ